MRDLQLHNGSSYRLIGDPSTKPVLVLIHGVGLNQDLWRRWIPILKNEFSVLTIDLLGHGDSHNPPGDRSARDFVNQLYDLLTHLKIDQFALAGFSLGALVSQAFASIHSLRLTHLILLHSVYQRTEEQCDAVRTRYLITREQGPLATVELAIERWFSESYRLSHTEEMDELRGLFSMHTDDGYLKACYLFGHAESEMRKYRLGHVNCPALVITGSEDKGSTPAMSEALARDLPHAELIINPGYRHMGPAEFAEVMANQVLSFLIK